MNKTLKQNTLKVANSRLSKIRLKNKQGGFTLIEIAIVLVIIGLLLGGVLKGQELINTARVRALNSTVDGITAAWFSFQDRYRAFPGDYDTAQSQINLPGAPEGGDANGQVDTVAEAGRIWVHLQAAGYITGDYTDDTVTIALDEYASKVAESPDNGFGIGVNLVFNSLIKGTAGADAHELITGRGIPVEVLAELDRKVDDGLPRSGAMQLGINGTGWAESDTCERDETATVGSYVYEILSPVPNCAAVFRNF